MTSDKWRVRSLTGALVLASLIFLFGCSSVEVPPGSPGLSIFANGELGTVDIPLGERARITWHATDVRPGSCAVYGPGRTTTDRSTLFNGSGSAVVEKPGQSSDRIWRDSYFVLTCQSADGAQLVASVAVAPSLKPVLNVYPLATLSSLAFYILMLALCLPSTRGRVAPLFFREPSNTQNHFAAFDPIRGIAAAMVAISHSWWSTYPLFGLSQPYIPFLGMGTKAVPIFAALSGFLIYRSVLSIRTLTDMRAYIIRRFFRIYPVYAAGVMLCLLSGQYIAQSGLSAVGFFVGDLFMLRNVDWPGPYANPPTWSLYVESVFYAFLPLLVLFVGARRMLATAGLMLIAVLVADYPSQPFALWSCFLFGIVASEISSRLRRLSVPALVVGIAFLIYDFGGKEHNWAANWGVTRLHDGGAGWSLGLCIAMMLILASLPNLSRISSVISVMPLRLLGSISYSVYVVHFFYIAANFPQLGILRQWGRSAGDKMFDSTAQMPWWYLPFVFFPGILFWGAVSYLVVERPGIEFGSRLARNAGSRS